MATQNCSNKQSVKVLNVQLGDSNESQQVLGAVNTCGVLRGAGLTYLILSVVYLVHCCIFERKCYSLSWVGAAK